MTPSSISTCQSEKEGTVPWTRFMDMHSGGGTKEGDYEHIYIEAPDAEARVIFYNRFGHNPTRVSCTCCGDDYSIDESPELWIASAHDRNCKTLKQEYVKDEQRWEPAQPYEDRPMEPGDQFYYPGYRDAASFVPLAEYVKQSTVLVIPASESDVPMSTEPRTWGICRGCGNARDLEYCLMCEACVRGGVQIPKIGEGHGDGEDISIVRDERDRLRAENERLKREHGLMLTALKSVYTADKTPAYEYPGGRKVKAVVNGAGEMPGPGRRWCTPREIAWTTMGQVESRAASDEERA